MSVRSELLHNLGNAAGNFAGWIFFSAFVLSPGKADIKPSRAGTPAYTLLNDRDRHYPENTPLSIIVEGRLVRAIDGKAINPEADIAVRMTLVIQPGGKQDVLVGEGDSINLVNTDAKIIHTNLSAAEYCKKIFPQSINRRKIQ